MKLLSAAILGFILVLAMIHFIKPQYVYHPDGSLREFGVGYKQKTVIPMWLVVIVAAVGSYSVCYLWLD
jgi:hypothetical protein